MQYVNLLYCNSSTTWLHTPLHYIAMKERRLSEYRYKQSLSTLSVNKMIKKWNLAFPASCTAGKQLFHSIQMSKV